MATLVMAGFFAHAQDTEFWFVAPQLDDAGSTHSSNFNRPVYFMITAGDAPATVTMEMPAFPNFNNRVLHLAAHESQRIIFGSGYTDFERDQMDTIQNKIRPPNQLAGDKYNRGIYFHSTAPITMFYQLDSYNSKDLFAMKGKKALGKKFYTPFQTLFQTTGAYQYGYPQFHIVATEDNTTVKITPKSNIVGTNAGDTKTVILDRGETFAARTVVHVDQYTQAPIPRLSGSYVEADKPVAVTVCDDLLSTGVPADATGDQLVPVENLGKEYVVVRGFASESADYCDKVFILATENGTTVKINGTSVPTLNAGEQYCHSMQTWAADPTAVISASHPVYVYQLSGYVSGAGTELGAVLVPSMYSINSRRISFYKSPTAHNHNIFVLVREGNESSFTVNGNENVLQASYGA